MRATVMLACLLLPALAGCLGGQTGGTSTGPVPEPSPDPARPLSSYLHDLSPVDEAVTVLGSAVEQHRILVEEDVEIDSWIVRPRVDGPVPLVLTVTPYYPGGSPIESATEHRLGRLAEELVPRGYAVGVASVRGTGMSEGCFTQGGAQEAHDTTLVIQHFASQPWSNGNVGLIGVSYDGTTPQDVWVEAPEALRTIVPVSGISDLYKYSFVNGVPINVQGFGFTSYYWALVGLLPFPLAGPTTDPGSIPGAALGEACAEQAGVQEGGVSSTADGNKDAYWQERDFLAELRAAPDRERASVLYVHGLQDWNVMDHHMEDWLPAVQATGVPFKAMLGQWGHAWPQSANPDNACRATQGERIPTCRNDWWNQTLVAWFDQFLKGIDTGILDAPAVQVQDDDGVWRNEDAWPPETVPHILHPSADGTLGTGPGTGDIAYFDGFGADGDTAGTPAPGLPTTPTTVAFVSAPLERDLRLSGLPRITLGVTADANRASLVLTLAERTGSVDRPFNYAAQSLNHVASLAQGQASVAGVRQTVTVDFFPAEDVLHAGSRLVLLASGNMVGSDYGGDPRLQPVTDGATITLHLDGAILELPVDESVVPESPQPFDA